MSIFAVIGGNGSTGREIIFQLLRMNINLVLEVRAVIRNAHAAERKPDIHIDLLRTASLDTRLSLISGDCTKPLEITAALKGVQVVFFCASGSREGFQTVQDVDSDGVRIVAEAAVFNNVERMILVSSQLVHPKNKWNPIRIFLNTMSTGLFHGKGLMDLKWDGEQYLRQSGVTYTIIRPPRLSTGTAEGIVEIAQTSGSFRPQTPLARRDLAAICVKAAFSSKTRNVTMEVGSFPQLSNPCRGITFQTQEMKGDHPETLGDHSQTKEFGRPIEGETDLFEGLIAD